MIALVIYLLFLFFLGIASAVVSYHILRYRDPDDASLTVLVVFFIVSFVILIGTAFLIDWNTIFNGI